MKRLDYVAQAHQGPSSLQLPLSAVDNKLQTRPSVLYFEDLRDFLLWRIQILNGEWSPKEWNAIAFQVYRYQFKKNPVFFRWLKNGRASDPLAIKKKLADGLPALQSLPIIAFKESQVRSFKRTSQTKYFESSGTTKSSKPSRHYFRSLNLYEASVVAGWKARMQPVECLPQFIGVMSSPLDCPHSSLSKMVAILMDHFGDGNEFWCMKSGKWNWKGFQNHLQTLQKEKRPSVLFGTAFGWVHFIDWCRERKIKFTLSLDTLVLETGGYKGRSRELTREALFSELRKLLGKNVQIQSEYSMCEISSQAYSFRQNIRDSSRIAPTTKDRHLFRFPSWCRYRVVCPLTSKPTKRGEAGVLEIHDLANLDSCAFIRTEDMAIDHGIGFELLGRLPRAGLKGCSLAFEN